MNKLWIDVKIPYEPENKLAYAYNRAMKSTSAEWVLFLDHDLFICNPHWYAVCLSAIEQTRGMHPGWITAKCNRIAGIAQKHEVVRDNDDILHHIEVAKALYKKHGNKVRQITDDLSGFFILTNKTAWDVVGGFKDVGRGLFGIDNEYRRVLAEKNFGLFVIDGLYFYHLYKRKKSAFEGF